MNTNNKVFKQAVQDYIKSCLLDADEIYNGYFIETDEENLLQTQLQVVVHEFKNYYGEYEQKQHPNVQDAFVDWLQGLPSSLSIDFVINTVESIMRDWFKTIDKEFIPNDSSWRMFRIFIFIGFNNLCKQNNVKGLF